MPTRASLHEIRIRHAEVGNAGDEASDAAVAHARPVRQGDDVLIHAIAGII